jgi:hypothetical protein
MKALILLSLLVVSCGKHTLLTMPEIDLNYDKGGDSKDSETRPLRVQAATLANCNMQTYRNRCTGILNTTRQLLPHELYNNFCASEYINCLNRR